MAVTLSRNLKLRIDSNLTANAKYNLERLDLIGANFLSDSANNLLVRSQGDIVLEPNSPDVGGTGSGGVVQFGTSDHPLDEVRAYTAATTFVSPVGIEDSQLRLYNGSFYTALQAGVQLANIALTMPTSAPLANQILRANLTTPTNLEWATAGSGTVTSVDMTVPTEFAIAGNPVTTSGTLALTKSTQAANTLWAGPTNGANAQPSFRTLVSADLPAITHASLSGLGADDHLQYHTDTRALTWLGTRSTTDLPEGSNLYYTASRFNTAFAAKSTTDLAEGSNLYYTDARFDTRFGTKSTTNLAEGTNLYYTDARFDTRLATKDTDDLAEGGNLYYTDERAQDSVGSILVDSSSIDFTYNDGLPSITASVLPAGVDHDALLNFVANEHVDHTSVSITSAALGGLTGGGDITLSRSFTVDPTNATSASVDNGDIVLFADVSDSNNLKKTTVSDILSLGGGSFAEDWTSMTTHTTTHNLGSRDVMVQLYDNTTFETIYVDTVIRTDSNTVDFTASQAPTGAGWRILVKKV